ncbi:MAG: HIT family protein, partial [Candidatus Aenigmatarchaeota archaeon]
MECIFCKIARKEIKTEIIYEDESSLAFLDINPISPGHTVVIPKKHSETILDMDDDEIGPMFIAVKRATEMLKDALSPDAFNIGINHGRKAGQGIDHVHVHIIPRFEGDGGGSIHTIVRNPPKESIEEMAERIKSASKSGEEPKESVEEV